MADKNKEKEYNVNVHHTSDSIHENLGFADQGGGSVSPVSPGSETSENTYTGSGDDYYQEHVDEVSDGDVSDDAVIGSGTGMDAPEETEYVWDKDGKKVAKSQYELDKQSAIQESLGKRQEISQAGQEAQQQHALQEYSDRQSAQRAGWTGGYVLDQNRQRDYLKASIESNMYGSMELQKLGFESQLASARLAYDINKEELALERYRTAYEHAVAEASLTGVWVSPEIHDMNQQYLAAQQMLDEMDETDDSVIESSDYQRAKRLIETIQGWYGENGVSPQGVETMAKQEFNFAVQQSRIEAATAAMGDGAYLWVDENSDHMFTPAGNPRVIDFLTDTPEEIMEFLNDSGNGAKALNNHLDYLTKNTISRLLGENSEATPEEILDLFKENNPILKLLESLGEDAIDYLRDDRITTDAEGNRAYTLTHSQGGHAYTISVALDGQDTPEPPPGDEPGGDDESTSVEIDENSFVGEDTQIDNQLNDIIESKSFKHSVEASEARAFLQNYYEVDNLSSLKNIDEGLKFLTDYGDGVLSYDNWLTARKTLDPTYDSNKSDQHWFNYLEGFTHTTDRNTNWLPTHNSKAKEVTLGVGYGSTRKANYDWQGFADMAEALDLEVEYNYNSRNLENRGLPNNIKIKGIDSVDDYHMLLYAFNLVNLGKYRDDTYTQFKNQAFKNLFEEAPDKTNTMEGESRWN